MSSPFSSLSFRVVSTGALRMGSWTPVIPETSPKASMAFQTMLMQLSPFPPTVTVAGKGSTSSRESSTGSTNFNSNPARRSVKAALCQPCLSTLPCFSGTAGRTFLNSSSGADPLMEPENPNSSAGTGMVCQGKWTLLWPAESTSLAPHSTLPRPKNRSLSVEAESATVHAEGVATDAAIV